MRPFLFMLLILLTVSCSKSKEDGFTINGFTSNLPDSTLILIAETNKPSFDSTWIIDNHFKFEGKIDQPFLNVWITLKDMSEYKSIWIMNNKMTFDSRGTSFYNAQVSGSEIQDQSNEYQRLVNPFRHKQDSIENLV